MTKSIIKWIKRMSTLRKVIVCVAILFIIYHLIRFDYQDLSWKVNSGHYLGFTSMVFVILSMIYSELHERKQNKKDMD